MTPTDEALARRPASAGAARGALLDPTTYGALAERALSPAWRSACYERGTLADGSACACVLGLLHDGPHYDETHGAWRYACVPADAYAAGQRLVAERGTDASIIGVWLPLVLKERYPDWYVPRFAAPATP